MAMAGSSLHLVEQQTGFPKLVTPIVPVRRMESVWPSRPQLAAAPRRQPSRAQGRGLEVLGHAVEYLLDSRIFLVDRRGIDANGDAIHLLKRLSRKLFEECPEQVTVWHRLARVWRPEARPAQTRCIDC